MSNKEIEKNNKQSPEQLEDNELDQVSGGEQVTMNYEQIKFNYSPHDTKKTQNKRGITAQNGDGGI